MAYFLIENSEGDVTCEVLTKAEVLERFDEDDWGPPPDYATAVPDSNLNRWGGKAVLIKGEVIVPKPVQRITEWTLD